MLIKLREHEIESIGLSLDGSTATLHEAVRGVEGCFHRTVSAIQIASELGIPIQINALVSQETAGDLRRIYELLKTLPIARRSLFFLISVGRGKMLQPLTPDQAEKCLAWIYELSEVSPFRIKATEAPSYRRVALERMKQEGRSPMKSSKAPFLAGLKSVMDTG